MKTVGELKDKIKKFSDTEDLSNIKDDELCCFVNMALQSAQKILSSLNKEYFTSCDEQDIAEGSSCASLPDDINGSKIKRVFWISEDGTCCKITRGSYDCECKSTGPTKPVDYLFFNKKNEGPKLYFNPSSTTAGKLRVIYERKPCEIDETTDPNAELEMQECCDYLFWHVLFLIYLKEKSPLVNAAISSKNEAEQRIVDVFGEQFIDEDNCQVQTDSDWEPYVNESFC